jgi:twitching motility protein PilT
MEKIIKAAVERGASDLHIKAGDVFRARINGKLVALTKQALTPDQTKAIALRLIANEDDRVRIDKIQDYDCSWGAPGIGRFRVNILRQRSSFMIVLRVIPFEVPTVAKLGLPAVLGEVASVERGLVLVAGPTGSGRSSTIAALVNHINESQSRHIVTLEQPIELLHRDLQSSVTQREVGVDTENFRTGVKAAMRQDADVIVVGDIRDADAADISIAAAVTGRLVIAAMEALDAPGAIQRIVQLFDPSGQDSARVRLAEALHAVIAQRLLMKLEGEGRVPVVELLRASPRVRELILEKAPAGALRTEIAAGDDASGSQTFEQHLAQLVASKDVGYDVAMAASLHQNELEKHLRLLWRRSKGVAVGDVMEPTPASVPAIVADLDRARAQSAAEEA